MADDNHLHHMHLVTVVWGELHRSLFTQAALPTLLSSNNLPALAGSIRLTYTIYTTPYDAKKIRDSQSFEYLQELVEVSIIEHDDFLERDTFSEHHHFQYREQCRARDDKAFMVSVVPDIVWSDGSLPYLRKLFEQGKRIVFLKCLRVNSETFIPELLTNHTDSTRGAVTIDSRHLVGLMLRHLHPLTLAQFEEADNFTNFAELLVWPVSQNQNIEGLVVGAPFPSDLLFFYPATLHHVDENQVLSEIVDPDEIAFVVDSDDMVLATPTPTFSYNEWFLDRGPMDPIDVARTSLDFGTDFTKDVARQKFRLHTGKIDEAAWKTPERRAGLVMQRIQTLREYLRLWRICRKEGATRTASILSTLMHRFSRLPTVGRHQQATIFIPADGAFGDETDFEQLLFPSRQRALFQRLRAHVVPGHFNMKKLAEASRTLETLAHDTLNVSNDNGVIGIESIRIIRGDIEAGPFLIHIIDGVLPSSAFSS